MRSSRARPHFRKTSQHTPQLYNRVKGCSTLPLMKLWPSLYLAIHVGRFRFGVRDHTMGTSRKPSNTISPYVNSKTAGQHSVRILVSLHPLHASRPTHLH